MRIKELLRSAEQTIALPLKIDFAFKSGLLSEFICLLFSVLRESVLSYDSSPGSRSPTTSAEVGGLHP